MPELMPRTRLFNSFSQGGFECASQRRWDGRRLDLLESTGHARYFAQDYQTMVSSGLHTVRDGLRWHLIEPRAGHYDWSSFLPMLRAAKRQSVQVIWDLCHYGYPDDVDIWRPQFVERFARFAGRVARLVREESDEVPFYSPVNEISYWSWAGGDVGYFNPSAHQRGAELKHQLVRASIAAIEVIRDVDPRARFVQCEPLINVIPRTRRSAEVEAAERCRVSQFEAWDLLAGRQWPGLGGREEYLDIIGVNYYPHNQWFLDGDRILQGDSQYRPLSGMLSEASKRYQRPMVISETGAEGDNRLGWLRYIADQVAIGITRGLPLHGICWYPIVDYPGWDDDRYCPAGMFAGADASGQRTPYQPLVAAMQQTISRFRALTEQ